MKNKPLLNPVSALFAVALCLTLMGCSGVYYSAMEKFGYAKRDIMVSRIEEARDAQTEAKEEFKTALQRFNEVIKSPGGELEAKYNKLNGELQRSEKSAKEVSDRIDSVEKVSEDLFKEWKTELGQYKDAKLRAESERELKATRVKYDDLMVAMRRAESKLEPVLIPLRDQVLFLKHHLNAQAIASIGGELNTVQDDVNRLVKEMEASIAEANEFINAMKE